MKKLLFLLLALIVVNFSFGQLHFGIHKEGDSTASYATDTVYGGTVSLFANNKYVLIHGLDVGIISNEAEIINGIVIAPIYNRVYESNGITISGITNLVYRRANGIVVSSAFNKIRGNFTGLAVCGGINFSDFSNRKIGCVIAGVANVMPSDKFIGLLISGLYNKCGYQVKGLFASGLRNSFNGNVYGVAISGFGNRVQSNTRGLLVGAINYTYKLKGCTIGLYNTDYGADGVKMGFVNITKKYNTRGFTASVLTNYGWEATGKGLCISGGVNIYDKFDGISVSGFGSFFDRSFNGVAITPGVNIVGGGKGLLVAGLMNKTIDFNGLSISLLNIGKSTYQIGLVNISKSSKVQVGLLNFNRNGKVKFLPICNMSQKKK